MSSVVVSHGLAVKGFGLVVVRFGLVYLKKKTFCEAKELYDVCSSVEIKENCFSLVLVLYP